MHCKRVICIKKIVSKKIIHHFVALYIFYIFLQYHHKANDYEKIPCLSWIIILATLGLGSCNDNIEVV